MYQYVDVLYSVLELINAQTKHKQFQFIKDNKPSLYKWIFSEKYKQY